MKKQFILEWITKKGGDGWKSLGYDLTNEEVEKHLRNKIKESHVASVWMTWSPVGNDVVELRIGEENFVKGYRKRTMKIGDAVMWLDDVWDLI